MIQPNSLLQGDCLDIMRDIPDGSIDAIICDLPYEVLHKNNPHAQWDRIIPFQPLWEQYKRIAKPTAAIVLFCQGMFTAKLMMSQPKLWRYNLIWDKINRPTGFLNANRCQLRIHEDIAVFYQSQPTYNPQMTKGVAAHRRGAAGNAELAGGKNRCYGGFKMTNPEYSNEKFPTSIIAFEKEHDGNQWHPTQKPVDLIRYLIRTYTNEGETVLDNCCGSGTTAIAAIREKRNYICIEKDPHFYEVARKRIDNELRQPTLF